MNKTTVDQLPEPLSRVELFLDYIARNGSGGNGGSGNGSVTIDKIQGLREELDKFVEDWEDLSDITKITKLNRFNNKETINGSYYNENGNISNDSNWARHIVSCQPGQQLTIVKRRHDSSNVVYLTEDGTFVKKESYGGVDHNEWRYYGITVPSDESIAKIGFNIHKPTNSISEIMVYDDHSLPGSAYIPFTNGASILVDSNNVAQSFDTTGTDLVSSTIHEAIKEVNNKIPKEKTNKVFDNNNNIWKASYFRIPSLLRTNNGTLLAFSDIRYNTPRDQSLIDIGVARSTDNGDNWDYKIALKSNKTTNVSRVMDSTSLITRTGRIILLAGGWDRNTNNWTSYNGMPDPDWNPYIVTSTDGGVIWSEKVSLKGADKCANQPQGTVSWLGGVGAGIEMENGTLIFPIQICYFETVTNGVGRNKVTKSGLIYSTDNGDTWTMSSSFVSGTENMIVEVNGSLIMNARNGNNRASYITSDLGENWSTYEPLHGKILNRNHGCQGSFIAFDTISGHRVGLISTPKNFNNNYTRDNITIYMIDFDNVSAGIRELLVPYPFAGNASGAGYSSLAYGTTKEGQRKLDIIYEDNGSISHQDITFLLSEIEDIVALSRDISWNQLSYASETKDFYNLYNTTNRFEAQGTFISGGNVTNETNPKWRRVVIPVVGGKTYQITSVRGVNNSGGGSILGSSDVLEFKTENNTFNKTTCVNSATWGSGVKVFNRNTIKHTTNKGTTHIGFNIYIGYQDAKIEFMVWESSQTPPSSYVQNSQLGKVLMDGSRIDISFESTGDLTSSTIREALDEINEKISLSGGNNGVSVDIYKLGELKVLAYDAGEEFKTYGRTWLRCDGQSLPVQNYNDLYRQMKNTPNENQSTITLPNKPEIGYLYICVK